MTPVPVQTSYTMWGGDGETGCFLETLGQVAGNRKGWTAIRDGDRAISYDQLAAWVNRIAELLADRNLQAGDRVAVTGPRSGAVIAAALGIAAAGATYVPLDADYPARRLEHMLADSRPRLVLYAGDAPALATATTVPVPRMPDPVAGRGAERLTAMACRPDSAVYVIYTSGSTGFPKGVAVPHRCIDNMAAWQRRHSVRADVRTAQFAPLNFDVWFQEVLGTLCAGGTLSVMPEALRRDPFQLLEWLAKERIERLFLPYVALQMLAVAAEATESLEKLQLIELNTAGEQLVCTPAIRDLFRRIPGCRLNNHYGQSESAMVTVHTLHGSNEGWPMLPPIGNPLPGCEVLIAPVDSADPSVGELLVAGAPLSDGYLHQSVLSAERYVEVSRTPRGHTRAFRTGDLVRVADGTIHFIGRVDHEVKIRGVRVNPLEVDACLLEQPGVVEAVTVAVKVDEGSRQLRAAVTTDDPHQVTGGAVLLRALAGQLPEHAVPVSVTVLPELPRTPSGKFDRDSIARTLTPATRRSSDTQPGPPAPVPAATVS